MTLLNPQRTTTRQRRGHAPSSDKSRRGQRLSFVDRGVGRRTDVWKLTACRESGAYVSADGGEVNSRCRAKWPDFRSFSRRPGTPRMRRPGVVWPVKKNGTVIGQTAVSQHQEWSAQHGHGYLAARPQLLPFPTASRQGGTREARLCGGLRPCPQGGRRHRHG